MTATVTPAQRLYYMDAMRSVLMMGGVFLHAAQIFNPEGLWLLVSESTSMLMYWIVEFIRIFRMESFFVVSGFFCFFTLSKYGTGKFLTVRLTRILVPFIVTALTLNSLQTFWLFKAGLLQFDWITYVKSGQYVSHLWFLINLSVYFLVFAVLYRLLASRAQNLTKMILDRPILFLITPLLFWPYGIIVLGKLGIPVYENLWGVFDVYSLLEYLPYFLLGYLAGINRALLNQLTSFSWWSLIIGCVVSNAVLFALQAIGGTLETLFYYLLKEIQAWVLVLICFKLFFQLTNRAIPAFRFLSDASYTVYLFHHGLVVLFGLLWLKLNTPYYIGYPVTVILTLGMTLLVHRYLISQVSVLSFLYNGKPVSQVNPGFKTGA